MSPEKRRWVEKIAMAISVLFHPVFIPVYGLLILFSAPTLLSYIPFHMKRVIFMLVIANNVILPLSVTIILYSRGVIKTIYAKERNERIILLTFSLLLYAVTALLLVKLPVPNLFKAYFVSIAVVTLIALVVTTFYKISLHSMGLGGLIALAATMIFIFDKGSIGYITSLVLGAGAVLSSRIYLDEHSPSEVWLGLMTGAGAMGLSLYFLIR